MAVYEFQATFNKMLLNATPEADVIGTELEKLSTKHGGAFTPKQVVDEYRGKRSKLHKVFEWDDSVAGELHREDQARALVRSVRVIKPDKTGHRAYTSVRAGTTGAREYVPTEVGLASPMTRDEILLDCLGGLTRWRKRWAEYNELTESLQSVDVAIKSIEELVSG